MGVLDPYRGNDPLIRTYTAAQWTAANYVLLDGELGIETDTGKQKAGEGKPWLSTSYFTPTGFTGQVTILDEAGEHVFTFANGLLTGHEIV